MKNLLSIYILLILSFAANAQKAVNTSPQLAKILNKVEIIDRLNWNAEDFDTYEKQIERLETECKTFDCGEVPIQLKLYRAVDEINQGKSNLLYQFVLPTIEKNQVQNPITKAFLNEQAGLYYILNGQLDSCYYYLKKAEKIFSKSDAKHKRFGTTSEYLGFYYSFQNVHDTSINYMQQAIQIYQTNEDTLATIKARKYLSSFYNIMGETEKSIETLLDTKRLVLSFSPAAYFINRIDAGLANAYSSLNNYQKVEDISKKAILRIENQTTKVNNDLVDLWDFYLILGEVQLKTNRLNEGLKNIKKAKEICQENDFPKIQYVGTLVSEADAQIQLKLFAEAEKTLKEILEDSDKIDGYNTKIADLILRLLLSDYKPTTNFVKSFKSTLKRLMEQHENLDNTDALKVIKLQTVFDIYNQDTKAALRHFQDVMTMNDSIESTAKNTALNELLVQQENLEQAQLLAQQEIEIKNKTIQRNRLIAGVLILLILAFGLYFFYYQKQQLAKTLEQEVQKRTAELKVANQNLLKSNKELERFNHATSHDLKEPLRNILSFIGLIERKNLATNEDLNSYFKHVKNNANQMYQLLENIIQYTEIKNQKIELEIVSIYNVITEVEFAEKEIIQAKNAVINYPHFPKILANESLLFLIFNNLVQNGLKFNESTIPTIDITYQEEDNFHWFTIADNGIGIETAYQKSVFELFKRLHNRGEYKGSGVGLAMTKQIIDDLGGTIQLESEFEKGTKVRFSIPK